MVSTIREQDSDKTTGGSSSHSGYRFSAVKTKAANQHHFLQGETKWIILRSVEPISESSRFEIEIYADEPTARVVYHDLYNDYWPGVQLLLRVISRDPHEEDVENRGPDRRLESAGRRNYDRRGVATLRTPRWEVMGPIQYDEISLNRRDGKDRRREGSVRKHGIRGCRPHSDLVEPWDKQGGERRRGRRRATDERRVGGDRRRG